MNMFWNYGLRRLIASILAVAIFSLIGSSAGRAEDFPTRIIRFIVPYPAGGPGDVTFRLLAQQMSEKLGQSIIVENRPGANGAIASQYAADAKPDGYTLLQTVTSTLVLYPAQHRKANFQNQLVPVGQLLNAPLGIVLRKDLPVSSVNDLIELAKKRPGELNYGTAGVGSIGHLLAEDFSSRQNIKMQHVPFSGDAPIYIALQQGQIDVGFVALPGSVPFLTEGTIKGLVTTGSSRRSDLPQLPTGLEEGFPELEATTFYGLHAPAGTAEPIIKKLSDALVEAVKEPSLQDRLKQLNFDPVGGGPQVLAAEVKRQKDRWEPIVVRLGLVQD